MAEGERQPKAVTVYRDERPLTDLIPPDRRRSHSVLLVSASVFTGAMLLLLGQQIYSAMVLSRQDIARPSTVVHSLVEGPVFAFHEPLIVRAAPSSEGPATAPFDRGAAAAALGAINVQSCHATDGPTGSGHVQLTFAPSGTVSSAVVDTSPFASTPSGNCIAAKFAKAKIPAFGGGPVRVGKSFMVGQ